MAFCGPPRSKKTEIKNARFPLAGTLNSSGLILLILGTWHIQSRIEAVAHRDAGFSPNTVLRASQQSLHDWTGEHEGEAVIWAGSKDLPVRSPNRDRANLFGTLGLKPMNSALSIGKLN